MSNNHWLLLIFVTNIPFIKKYARQSIGFNNLFVLQP